MDIYFIPWDVIQYYFILFLKFGLWELFQLAPKSVGHTFIIWGFLSTFLLFGMLQARFFIPRAKEGHWIYPIYLHLAALYDKLSVTDPFESFFSWWSLLLQSNQSNLMTAPYICSQCRPFPSLLPLRRLHHCPHLFNSPCIHSFCHMKVPAPFNKQMEYISTWCWAKPWDLFWPREWGRSDCVPVPSLSLKRPCEFPFVPLNLSHHLEKAMCGLTVYPILQLRVAHSS